MGTLLYNAMFAAGRAARLQGKVTRDMPDFDQPEASRAWLAGWMHQRDLDIERGEFREPELPL